MPEVIDSPQANRKRVVVVGAGGHARELAQAIRALGDGWSFEGYVVSDLDNPGRYASTEALLGDFDWLKKHRGDRFDALALGVGLPSSRVAVAERLEQDFDPSWWPAIVHPTAIVDLDSCRLGHGAYVGAGVVGTVNLVFAPFAVANFGCTLGHEASLGRGTVVMPGANVSGGVTLGDAVMVGTGAQVLQYLTVGDRALVGAGAVVTRDVPPGVTVVGVPARPVG